MSPRLLLSDWVGGSLTLLLGVCLLFAIHDHTPSTPSQKIAVETSMATLGAWVLVKSFDRWRVHRGARDTADRGRGAT